MGKPKKILYSYDEDGHACGFDKGYEKYKMLYFYNVIENLEKFKLKKIVNAFCVDECPSIKYNKEEYKNKNITLNCKPTEDNPNCTVAFKNYYRAKSLLKRFCFPSDSDNEEFDSETQEKILVYDYTKKINIERIVDKEDISSDGEYVKISSLKEQNNICFCYLEFCNSNGIFIIFALLCWDNGIFNFSWNICWFSYSFNYIKI